MFRHGWLITSISQLCFVFIKENAVELAAYRDEIKLRLTGGVLDLEINDAAIDGCINSAFR